MVIAVNTRFLFPDYREGYGNFLYEVFGRITRNNPQHQFLFIYDRPQSGESQWPSNVKHVVTGPPARHPLLWKWWYDYRIPAVLRKHKADIFISPDGFCSLRTSVPQLLVVHDLAFLHYPDDIKKSQLYFYNKYTPRFLKKASGIITVSEFSKKDIISNYQTDPGKIRVIYNGVKEIFHPLTEIEKAETKNKYTTGKEYFFYAGSIHPRKNLVHLLKAYSVFKKRQQSGMKLVLTGRLAWKYESFLKDLQSYKYRDDVIMTGYSTDEELVRLMGSAYALVYPSYWEGFGLPILEAMRSDVPVITSGNSPMQEIAKEAALYFDPQDFSSIAEKMMLIYKDEKLRRELIEKGRRIQAEYDWDKTARLVWDLILRFSA